MDFDLVGAGEFAQSATFFFQGGAPVCCGPDGPNYARVDRIHLYSISDSPTAPVQIDFAAPSGGSSPMPEPSAAVVFAAGALFVHSAIRRRRAGDDASRS